MRTKLSLHDGFWRTDGPIGIDPDEPVGAFCYLSREFGRTLLILAYDGRPIPQEGVDGSHPSAHWEHVSVSGKTFTPTWSEMCLVKDLFWRPDEAVVQFHPPETEYVNLHKHCLHLWKWKGGAFPLPPKDCV